MFLLSLMLANSSTNVRSGTSLPFLHAVGESEFHCESFIKGTGGSKVNFFVLTYFVALVMWGQELFTESKNLYSLPRYEVSKLGRSDPFSRIFINLYREIQIFGDQK